MIEPADVVRTFFERMQARDWLGASELVAPTVRIEYSETGEVFEGTNFLTMNEAYPKGWKLFVVETMAADKRVAAHVRVDHGDTTFWCAGFYTVKAGLIADGVEHWVTAGSEQPPEWRRPYTS